MSTYYEYMIWADVSQTIPSLDEEPSLEIQLSLFSRLVNGQRWSHVTRTNKIRTVTDYISTIVGNGVTPCIIIPQTGLNRKFTPEEATNLFFKAFIDKNKLVCFQIPESITDELEPPAREEDITVSRADADEFWDALSRNLAYYTASKDPDVLFSFLTSLQGRLADLLGKNH